MRLTLKLKIIFSLIFVFNFNILLGQSEQKNIRKNNAAYAEVFGNAQSILSVNYERLFNLKKCEYLTFGFRVGTGIAKSRFDHKVAFNFPTEFNTIIGPRKHKLEIGLGYTQILQTSNLNDTIIPIEYKRNKDFALFFRLGYRLINEKNFVFRIAPLIMFVHDPPINNSLTMQYTIGLSLGYCFDFKKN